MSELEKWLNKKMIAEHLCVTIRTVERWHELGLPFRRVGGVNRYRRSEVDAWVDALSG